MRRRRPRRALACGLRRWTGPGQRWCGGCQRGRRCFCGNSNNPLMFMKLDNISLCNLQILALLCKGADAIVLAQL